jgi:hypothetical protein
MKKYYTEFKEERKTFHSVKRRKVNWTGPILLMDCLLEELLKKR